jgi:ribosome-associated toxin RatA of RatAB toxin-antitoxin module
MTTEHAHEQATVSASPADCLTVALDYERYPEWAHDIKEASVMARDEQGRATTVAFRAAAMGRSASYTLRYSYPAPAPTDPPDATVIAWELIDGDIMRAIDGRYMFAPASDGGTNMGTNIVYELSVELVVPIPGFVKRRAEGKIMGTALRELKARVEQLHPLM